jgi:hypothetical protein
MVPFARASTLNSTPAETSTEIVTFEVWENSRKKTGDTGCSETFTLMAEMLGSSGTVASNGPSETDCQWSLAR